MAYVTGDTILDDHYNGFANDNSPNNINKIWGTGNGNFGYGQTNTISSVSAGGTVQASQWNTLLDRMDNIENHQGSSITTGAGTLSGGDPIAAILSISSDITTLATNRYNVDSSNLTQSSNPNSVNRTFTGNWSANTIQEVSFTFSDADAMRYFFNAGGKITHVWNLSGGTADGKYNEWVDLFNTKAATFTISAVADSLSGSGTASTNLNEGFWSASSDDSYTIHQKMFADTAPYTTNFCQWEVKMTGAHGSNGGIGNVITIKATATDAAADSVDEGQAPDDPLDPTQTNLDIVDGNLSSSWSYYKPNTTYLNNDAAGTITAAEVSQSQS